MACPASMRDVDAAGLAADPVPEADDEQATSSQAKTRTVTGRAMCRTCNPCLPGRGEAHVRVTPSCGPRHAPDL